jgi:MinD superfamily P-loop ATPase
MIIAVASGKGGTGKTTVAVSLALSVAGKGSTPPPLLVDCDVEEPNAGLFLEPVLRESRDVIQALPQIDLARCDLCGRCSEVCAYNALAVLGKRVLLFPELCHGCGSCTLNCPIGAIREVPCVKGVLERGRAGGLDFAQGTLKVGTAMPGPAIRQLKKWVLPGATNGRLVILDGPPGTSCPVVETMRRADFVLLVTEPTPFGLHDLRLAVEVARNELRLPVGVVVNRDGLGDRGVEDYCAEEEVPILMRIPHDRRIAEACSQGRALAGALPEYRTRFQELYEEIRKTRGGR